MTNSRTFQQFEAYALVAILIAATSALISCGKKSSETSASSSSLASTEKVIDDPTQPFTLALEAGELRGCAVDAPANSLPKNAKLTLAATTAPTEFANITSGDNSPASGALQLKIEDNNGAAIDALAPLTLSMPYTGDTALALSSPVPKTIENLLMVLKAADNKLYYWARAAFAAVDTENKLVSVGVIKGGTFALAYAAQSAPPNFTDAASAGVAPSNSATDKSSATVDSATDNVTDNNTDQSTTNNTDTGNNGNTGETTTSTVSMAPTALITNRTQIVGYRIQTPLDVQSSGTGYTSNQTVVPSGSPATNVSDTPTISGIGLSIDASQISITTRSSNLVDGNADGLVAATVTVLGTFPEGAIQKYEVLPPFDAIPFSEAEFGPGSGRFFDLPRNGLRSGQLQFKAYAEGDTSHSVTSTPIQVKAYTLQRIASDVGAFALHGVALGGKLYFTAWKADGNRRVFAYDKSLQTITLISNTRNDLTANDEAYHLFAYDDSVFFVAKNASGKYKYFRYKPSDSSHPLITISTSASDSLDDIEFYSDMTSDFYPRYFVYDGKLLFKGKNSNGALKWFEYNGGTSTLRQFSNTKGDNAVSDTWTYGGEFAEFNAQLFFEAFASGGAKKLYRYDGTNVKPVVSLAVSNNPKLYTVLGGSLYFVGKTGNGAGSKIMRYNIDNTLEIVANLTSDPTTDENILLMKAFNNRLFIYGNNGTANKFYIYNGTTLTQLADLAGITPSDDCTGAVEINGKLMITLSNRLITIDSTNSVSAQSIGATTLGPPVGYGHNVCFKRSYGSVGNLTCWNLEKDTLLDIANAGFFQPLLLDDRLIVGTNNADSPKIGSVCDMDSGCMP